MPMRAIARRAGGKLEHHVEIGGHTITADEPAEHGGSDAGPSPQELLAASLASCTAVTMEMYANRKGWEISEVAVDVTYEPAQRGSPTKFHMEVTLPKELPDEQREKLMTIAAKCPVHRTLEGEVMFDESVSLGRQRAGPRFVPTSRSRPPSGSRAARTPARPAWWRSARLCSSRSPARRRSPA